MTARPDADAALALLRAEFPEPFWVNLSLRGGSGGRWYAVVQSRPWPDDESGISGGFLTIDAKGESRDAAARALIAARDAAFPAQGWRECADALAKALRISHKGARLWHQTEANKGDGCELCAALARYDALRKETERG